MLEHVNETALVEKENLLREYAGQRNAEARASIETSLRTRCDHMKGMATGMRPQQKT